MRPPVLGLGDRNFQEATLTLSNVSNCSPLKNMATNDSDSLSEGTELSGTLYLAELGVLLTQICSVRWSRLCRGVEQSWVTVPHTSMSTVLRSERGILNCT